MKPLAHDVYVYAGFRFIIERDEHGKAVNMRPEPGQHQAAHKDKHARNALESYLSDAGDFDTVRAALRAPAKIDTPIDARGPDGHITTPGYIPPGDFTVEPAVALTYSPFVAHRAAHRDAVRTALARTTARVEALPPVDLGPDGSDPPSRAARVTKHLDEHPEVETTITTWKRRGSLAEIAETLDASAPCPSCDEPLTPFATTCGACGAPVRS